jgi:glycosyltransferase involved in cell wall biosynthesis
VSPEHLHDREAECELSIVMPCLNEARTVGICVSKAMRFLLEEGISGEVVVADNGSTDGSQEIAARAGARVVSVEQKGYGNAIRGGIAAARGRYIIMGDSDDSYDFANLRPFVEKLREGYDLVMGNRFKGGIAPGAMPALHRYLGNPVLTAIGRLFFGSPCGDFHCGLRGFSKHAYQRMDPHTAGMEFASEIVVKASLLRMRIAEVPTTLVPDGRGRPSHLRSWRDGWRHLRFLLLYSPRWLFTIPGLALFVAGGALGALLTFTPVRIGGVVFDTNTLLVCAMCTLVGFQLISFSVFAKAFAVRERLLPADEGTERFLKAARLEIGLLVGLGILALGLALLISAVLMWKEHAFGDLSYPDSLRVTIPSVTLIMLGLQVIFSSFLLGLFGLRVK